MNYLFISLLKIIAWRYIIFFYFYFFRKESVAASAAGQVNFIGRQRNPLDDVLSSLNGPVVSDIKVELENSRAAIRKLSQCLGTTIVSSSSATDNSTSDDDEMSGISSVAEQKDNEFASMYAFTTNVSYHYSHWV